MRKKTLQKRNKRIFLKKRKNNFFKNNLSKLQKQKVNDRFTALKEIEKANNQLLI